MKSKHLGVYALLLGSLLVFCAPVLAAEEASVAVTEQGRVTLVSAAGHVTPGQPLELGLLFQLEPDWHIYWRNPGDAGMPPQATWDLPPGFEAGAIQWPAPRRFPDGPLMSYGYDGEVLLPVRINVPAPLDTDEVVLRVRLQWLACKAICVPGRAELTLRLPTTPGTPAPDVAAHFARARAALPTSAHALPFTARADDQQITLMVALPPQWRGADFEDAWFYAADGSLAPAAPQVWQVHPDGLSLTLPWAHGRPEPLPAALEGVLVLPFRDHLALAVTAEWL
ncbi:MAG: hypothetical protein K9N49_08895 [Candidatus Marinimicrobia bacterium]|nr:hypothetical protein [Candidatus Neomarinimicrobiota bacterium]